MMTDIFTKSKRSQVMALIKSENTGPERKMAAILRKNKITFSKGSNIFGKPDFIIRRSKVAIFVDGRFWHGYDYPKTKARLSFFWAEKIARNIKRDRIVNRKLKAEGWKVIRFWDTELKNSDKCIKLINMAIR